MYTSCSPCRVEDEMSDISPALPLQVFSDEKVTGQGCGWPCLCLPPCPCLSAPWVAVHRDIWLLLRAPASSGGPGAASPSPRPARVRLRWFGALHFKGAHLPPSPVPDSSPALQALYPVKVPPPCGVGCSFCGSPGRAVPTQLCSLLFHPTRMIYLLETRCFPQLPA